jgi:hypothetical protein
MDADSQDGRRKAMKYLLMICDDESVILSPAEIAARHPAAASGTIEVRPLWQE